MDATRSKQVTKLNRANELQVKVFQMTKANIAKRLSEPLDFLPQFRVFMRQKEPYNNYLVNLNAKSPPRTSMHEESFHELEERSKMSSCSSDNTQRYVQFLPKCALIEGLGETSSQQNQIKEYDSFSRKDNNFVLDVVSLKPISLQVVSPSPVQISSKVIVSNARNGFKAMSSPLRNDLINQKLCEKDCKRSVVEDVISRSGQNNSIDSCHPQMKPRQPIRFQKQQIASQGSTHPLLNYQKSIKMKIGRAIRIVSSEKQQSHDQSKQNGSSEIVITSRSSSARRCTSPKLNGQTRMYSTTEQLARSVSSKRSANVIVVQGVQVFQKSKKLNHLEELKMNNLANCQ